MAFGAVGTGAHANNADVTPTLPAHDVGHTLGVVAIYRSTTGTPSIATAGWELKYTHTTSTSRKIWIFLKTATSSSETNPTVSVSGGAAGEGVGAFPFSLTGRHQSLDSLIAAVAEATSGVADMSVTFPALTVPQDNCDVLLVWMHGSNATNAQTEVSAQGFADAGVFPVAPAAATGGAIGIQYVEQTTATDITSADITVSGGANGANSAITIAFAEASSAISAGLLLPFPWLWDTWRAN